MTETAPLILHPLSFRSAGRSDRGAVRPLNEDRFLEREDIRLWAVADGMGGHHDGEAASALVVEALTALAGYESGYAFLNGVTAALKDANTDLRARASALPAGGVTGTTVVALLIHDDHAACVWAGDSRAYHLSDGEMRPLTRDHSLVQQLVDSGELDPAQAAGDRRANIITRAVGAEPILDLDSRFTPVSAGDRFLLCSDGLTATVSEAEIAAILAGADIQVAADTLMARALSRDPADNVTLVVVEAAWA